MDSVPLDFIERVWARCKCYAKPLFLAPNWNQTEESSQFSFNFYIGAVEGEWKYGFLLNSETEFAPSLDELLAFPNLKNARVVFIALEDRNFMLKHAVVDLEKLLNFVSFLSNEPALHLAQPEDSAGGAVLKWLEESRFSGVTMMKLTPVYHRILENTITESSRTPTRISVNAIEEESAEFLENQLTSGDLRWIEILAPIRFPSTVLDRLIRNILEDPQEYVEKQFSIQARFDDSAKSMMDEMVRNELCSVKDEYGTLTYTFHKQTPIIRVKRSGGDLWSLREIPY